MSEHVPNREHERLKVAPGFCPQVSSSKVFFFVCVKRCTAPSGARARDVVAADVLHQACALSFRVSLRARAATRERDSHESSARSRGAARVPVISRRAHAQKVLFAKSVCSMPRNLQAVFPAKFQRYTSPRDTESDAHGRVESGVSAFRALSLSLSPRQRAPRRHNTCDATRCKDTLLCEIIHAAMRI